MEVILLERVGKLGQMGDIVTVKDGYARNYLLPQNKALRATNENKTRFETQRAQLEARNLESKKEAEGLATKIEGQSFIVIRQAGDTGQLYGSVTTRDIAAFITEAGFSVTRSQVRLDNPIKILGMHSLHVQLHPEVIVTVNVNVARSQDEAARQARGEDVTQLGEEPVEGETIAVEEVFEDAELAHQAEEELKVQDEQDAGQVEIGEAAEEADSDADSDAKPKEE